MLNNSVFGSAIGDSRARDIFYLAIEDEGIVDAYSLLSKHNPNTARHCLGVGIIAAAFAETLNFSQDHSVNTVRVALLHDIGKVEIRNTILDKPGLLTKLEKSKIKSHPIYGYIKATEVLGPKNALPVLMHHRLQKDRYPSNRLLNEVLKSYDLSIHDIDQGVWLTLVCLVVADHYEARLPVENSTHAYKKRDYTIEDLSDRIRTELIAAGYIQGDELDDVFHRLVNTGRDISNRIILTN